MTIATSAERRWSRNDDAHQRDDDELLDQLVAQVAHRALDQAASGRRSSTISTPGGRLALAARRASPSPPRSSRARSCPSASRPCRRRPRPRRRARRCRGASPGPTCTRATSLERAPARRPRRSTSGMRAEVVERLQVAARAHHVLGLGQLDDRAAGLAVGVLDRLRSPARAGCRRRAAGPGSSTTWYCRTMPPTRRDLGDVRARAFSSYFRNQSWSARSCAEVVPAGAVDERVLVDPADAGRVGPERRLAPAPAAATAPGSGTRARASAPSTGRCRPRTARRRTSRRRTSSRAPSSRPAPTASSS